MRPIPFRFFLPIFLIFATMSFTAAQPYGLIIHGGAGNGITKENFPPERQQEYTRALDSALAIGYAILEKGGSAVDAVEATVQYLEDNPLFNAGRGSVYTAEGTIEMDAAIMDGTTGMAGAVAQLTRVRHPITAARLVMEQSPHVMLVSKGAEQFAQEQGCEEVPNSYFFTEKRYNEYLRIKARREEGRSSVAIGDEKYGTVGCVALDKQGNIAAGTSTGGTSYKLYGRVGDVPVIGAGTYADSKVCGISATGHGEFFIRNVVAYDIAARMKYLGEGLDAAARQVVLEKLKAQEGYGGIIGLDLSGNPVAVFNTSGMFHGWMMGDGRKRVGLW